MRLEWFVGIRYFKSRKDQKFLNLISLISVCGVAVGVATLIVVLGVMNGFDRDLREKIVGTISHITINNEAGVKEYGKVWNEIKDIKHVEAYAPFISGQGIIGSSEGVKGVLVRGIDPEEEIKVSNLEKYLVEGKFGKGVVIGSQLALLLNVGVGDEIFIATPQIGSNLSNMKVKNRSYPVDGIFRSGMYQYDSRMVYMSLGKAQETFGMGSNVGGISLMIDDIYKASWVRDTIRNKVKYPFLVRSWIDANANLFSALKLEKVTMFVILTLIVLVASFNIMGTLIMVVMHKTRDIAILKALGASSEKIMKIFTLEGVLIGSIGTFLGICLGLFVCFILEKYGLKLPGGGSIYYISVLPVQIKPNDVVFVSVAALVLCSLSGIYPAWRAARIDPVKVLRYE